jgi:hypothetical protein
VNAITKIRPPAIADDGHEGFDLTSFMRRNGVLRIAQLGDNFSVYITGDRMGCGKTVGEAFANARGQA